MATKTRRCVDCLREGVTTKRPAPKPGPRCASHSRELKQRARTGVWAVYIQKTYGISAEEYALIYEAQGGVCAICRRATGKTRRLSVDHIHNVGDGWESVRSILCKTCNSFLGHIRDDPEAAQRVVYYLLEPPGRWLLHDLRN